MASIAVGRSVGVAPEADLYFVGLRLIWARQPIGNWFVASRRAAHIGLPAPAAIPRILEINQRLDPGRKIRVISMSIFVAAPNLGVAPFGPVKIATAAAADGYIPGGAVGSWSTARWAYLPSREGRF